ncbi:MarR family winged helix-turn-helix transcriptional regulator [Novosphingobium sp.]|uniref:MarR family winged helix-turn-helix transcriptional regulator n=1 Tax=Novosphingobium sp. TaxID=1874826 RepID=UPI00286DB5F1|nr:MarR family winged helix-turn-helix transcriptional regulator [Novosphingobium sp.]
MEDREQKAGPAQSHAEFLHALQDLVVETLRQANEYLASLPQPPPPEAGTGVRPAILGGSRNLDWAKRAYEARRYRKQHLAHELFGEPAWDILLELYIAFHECRTVSMKAASFASDAPHATAYRNIIMLENLGLVNRVDDLHDRRVKWVGLTKKAIVAISRICEDEDRREREQRRKKPARFTEKILR